jgi:hypothetical protein
MVLYRVLVNKYNEKSTKKKIVVIFKRKERSKLSIFSKMDIQNEQKTKTNN